MSANYVLSHCHLFKLFKESVENNCIDWNNFAYAFIFAEIFDYDSQNFYPAVEPIFRCIISWEYKNLPDFRLICKKLRFWNDWWKPLMRNKKSCDTVPLNVP